MAPKYLKNNAEGLDLMTQLEEFDFARVAPTVIWCARYNSDIAAPADAVKVAAYLEPAVFSLCRHIERGLDGLTTLNRGVMFEYIDIIIDRLELAGRLLIALDDGELQAEKSSCPDSKILSPIELVGYLAFVLLWVDSLKAWITTLVSSDVEDTGSANALAEATFPITKRRRLLE